MDFPGMPPSVNSQPLQNRVVQPVAAPAGQAPASKVTATVTYPNGQSYPYPSPDLPDGLVTIDYSDGRQYEGYLVDKKLNDSTGLVTWTDGRTYRGDFKDGFMTGYGTQTNKTGEVTYKGEMYKGMRQGQGVCFFPDGAVYNGGFKSNKINGFGSIEWKGGKVYSGDFIDGQRTGMGRESLPNGEVYVGEFSKGQRCGLGIVTTSDKLNVQTSALGIAYIVQDKNNPLCNPLYTVLLFNDGDRYVGQFNFDSHKHGMGKCICAEYTYTGEFKKNSQDGKGVCVWKDGAQHDGQWKDGVKNGYGVRSGSNGVITKGNFVNDALEGPGEAIVTTGSGKGHYFGPFVDNQCTGQQGKFVFDNGDCYQGGFLNGDFHGNGELQFFEKGKYEGKFVNNKQTVGKYTYLDGKFYEGPFVNGLPQGKGKKTDPSTGIYYTGGFLNGMEHGYGELRSPDRVIFRGNFSMGQMVTSNNTASRN